MRQAWFLFLLIGLSFGAAVAAQGQDDDSPSLGDVARQARLAKQQKEPDSAKPAAQPAGNAQNPAKSSSDVPGQSAGSAALHKNSPTGQNKAENSPTAVTKAAQPGKPAKKVITDEDVGASRSVDSPTAGQPASAEPATADEQNGKNPPDYWSTRILAQKNAIASLKSDIDQLNASIQYAPGNCVSGCVEWNEQQKQKQQQVDSMKAQLEEQQKQLEQMQDAARKQGYGSSVYDP